MTLVTHPILVKRFAGTKSEKPMFKAFRDGKELFQVPIDGQPDVKPALLRVQTKSERNSSWSCFRQVAMPNVCLPGERRKRAQKSRLHRPTKA